MRAEKIYSIGNWMYKRNLCAISKLFDYLNLFLHNSYIPSKCDIGYGTRFSYSGIGVLINGKAKIGKYCIIGQGITIGMKTEKEVPTIGDHVYICAGARILGNITVGHHSIIGANAVVIRDVPPYSVVAGVPAKIIHTLDESSFQEKYSRFYLSEDSN